MRFTLTGKPITKKNHQRIVNAGGRMRIIQAEAYLKYRDACKWQINVLRMNSMRIASPVNLKCVYYMPTRHRVDLVNLLEATCDILVDAGVLSDDNCKIIVSHDGSRVLYDKDRPRVEIEITPANVEVTS